ncbi:MAG: hypothetical protein APF81_09845 [Desulfosporosinus sp. BRH_c37]|nr:MAG: hypothetical protein APF81_09845 [Desulfosporosinus sp. BRH_c37]
MNKSSKMVTLFLSTALVISSAGCGTKQQVVYDQNGNPITVEDDDDDDGYFGRYLAPFGFSKRHSSGAGVVRSPGVSSGSSSSAQNSVNSNSGSTKPVGGSSSTGGTGISSGSHGGIGGGGSSAS